LGGRRISSIFEIGAGNGSLLAELVELYPGLQVSGIEPVDAAAEFARSAGLDIQTAFIEAFDITSANSDVVLSVNVVEHVVDPVAFLATAATGMSENGCIIVVCPDGEIPSTELLIYDHVHSFTPRAMRLLAAKCGLAVTDVRKSPGEIGPFQALVLQRESTTPSVGSLETDSILHRERNAFLGAWEALERRLLARVNKTKTLTAFGFGESAQLLRTYAPNVWAKVDNIVADVDGFFDDKIVHRYRPDLTVAQEILLAVRPDLQPALVERLRGDGKHPIQWDDLVFIGHSV
jgi:SAM-dependent methyltransferase